MKNKSILFIHIPKTAGSSFREQMLVSNFGENYYRYKGWKDLLKTNRDMSIIGGHMPYGTHLLFKDYEYITFVREPIDRAISHYYFMVQQASPKYPNANKPHRELHQKTPLKDIFDATSRKKYGFSVFSLLDNLQTRYLAGYKHFWRSKDSEVMLNAAIYNLKQHISLFGIKESFTESLEIFHNVYGLEIYPKKEKLRHTRIEKIVTDEDMEVLRANHQLDLKLYEVALELFEEQKKKYL
jgi:hypothetical protein